jgi:hypothetical protein
MSHHEHRSIIEACVKCAQACEHCADACLGEKDVKSMAECIRRDRDCAQLCFMVVSFASRGSHLLNELCHLCETACEACASECGKHPMDHCRECVATCEHCLQEFRRVAGALA